MPDADHPFGSFATLSCISSLAVAPTLSIWRLTPEEYYREKVTRSVFEDEGPNTDQGILAEAVGRVAVEHKRKIQRSQYKQRFFLALALLAQVAFQWAWGIVLFVSPYYSQPNCSRNTQLIFFLAQFSAERINAHMFVWALWLLFSLGITMSMTIVLALTSPERARSNTQGSTPASTVGRRGSTGSRFYATKQPRDPPTPLWRLLLDVARDSLPGRTDRGAQLIFSYNIVCILLWLMYIAGELTSRLLSTRHSDLTQLDSLRNPDSS